MKKNYVDINRICEYYLPLWIKDSTSKTAKFTTYHYNSSGRSYIGLSVEFGIHVSFNIDYFYRFRIQDLLMDVCLLKHSFLIFGYTEIIDNVNRNKWMCEDCGRYIKSDKDLSDICNKKIIKEQKNAIVIETKIKRKEKAIIYLIEMNGIYKIGIACDINDRVMSLQTGSPYKINVITTSQHIMRDDAIFKEKKLHEKYKNLNISGEWFRLSNEDVCDVIEILKMCNVCNKL